MFILGYQKTTLLDYPKHVAATIFTGGCSFRCPFCHNSDLVLCSSKLVSVSEEEIFSFLKKRKNVLSGVCITGGEPTLQSDLSDFIEKIRMLDYKVKLDTNGYQPEKIEKLLEKNLINYIAMDVKAGFSNYSKVCGIPDLDTVLIKESIAIIEKSKVNYEFRTTVVKELHSQQDFYEIREMLLPQSPYYIQSFQNSGSILMEGLSSCDIPTLKKYLTIVQKKLQRAYLRGINDTSCS